MSSKEGRLGHREKKLKPDDDEDKMTPSRVDVRCRFQKVAWCPPGRCYFYKIFMAPHGKHFGKWCERIEKELESTCRDRRGQALDPDYVRLRRCDMDSHDDLTKLWGHTATIELLNWNKYKYDKKNFAGKQCVEDAIRKAANGSTVHWPDDKEKCQWVSRKYVLTDVRN